MTWPWYGNVTWVNTDTPNWVILSQSLTRQIWSLCLFCTAGNNVTACWVFPGANRRSQTANWLRCSGWWDDSGIWGVLGGGACDQAIALWVDHISREIDILFPSSLTEIHLFVLSSKLFMFTNLLSLGINPPTGEFFLFNLVLPAFITTGLSFFTTIFMLQLYLGDIFWS